MASILVVSRGNGGVDRTRDVEGSLYAWPSWSGASCSGGETRLKEARMMVTFAHDEAVDLLCAWTKERYQQGRQIKGN
jgi:hypothetical protein